jgi:AraC family transcriptional regulator, transcriptional activator of pobA
LLKNASLSIAQIAEELHFSDQFSFSKFFKRESGLTPSEYRK